MSNNSGMPTLAENSAGKEAIISDMAGRLDAALTEIFNADVSAGNVTMTQAQTQACSRIRISGAATTGRTVTMYAVKKLALVEADSGNSDPVKIKVGSAEHVLSAGDVVFVALDGTANGLTVFEGGGAGGAFTDLSDVPASYTGQAGKIPIVKDTEDGLEFATAPPGTGTDVTPPDVSDYALVGATSGASLAAATNGIKVTSPSVGNTSTAQLAAVRDVPATPYSARMQTFCFASRENFASVGPCFYESGSGKALVAGFVPNTYLTGNTTTDFGLVVKHGDLSAIMSAGDDFFAFAINELSKWRLSDNGTNVKVEISPDGGDNYVTLYDANYASAGFSGSPDKIGLWVNPWQEDGDAKVTIGFLKDFTAS